MNDKRKTTDPVERKSYRLILPVGIFAAMLFLLGCFLLRKVIFEDYSAVASLVSVYGQSDEYILPYLHNPTVPKRFKNVKNKDVILGKYVLIGTHSVVLPGVELGEGCSFGACSLINKSMRPGGLYVGRSCRRIYDRDLEEIRRLAQELTDVEHRKKEKHMAGSRGKV